MVARVYPYKVDGTFITANVQFDGEPISSAAARNNFQRACHDAAQREAEMYPNLAQLSGYDPHLAEEKK